MVQHIEVTNWYSLSGPTSLAQLIAKFVLCWDALQAPVDLTVAV
jgi:hypothetical protein